MPPTCQQVPEPRPWGGVRGGDKSPPRDWETVIYYLLFIIYYLLFIYYLDLSRLCVHLHALRPQGPRRIGIARSIDVVVAIMFAWRVSVPQGVHANEFVFAGIMD